jgi:hypothetical protein
MKKTKRLDSFKLESHVKNISNVFGGQQSGGGTASAPQSTMVASNPKCSDYQVQYDNDKGEYTGSCTTYACP